MDVKRTEILDMTIEDGAVSAGIDGGRYCPPDASTGQGQVDLEAGKLVAYVISIDIPGAGPELASDSEKVHHNVGGRFARLGCQVRQAVELGAPVAAIWPFLDLPYMQGPQDLMCQRLDRCGVAGADCIRNSIENHTEPVPKQIPGDSFAEQVIELIRLCMRSGHGRQFSQFIQVIC